MSAQEVSMPSYLDDEHVMMQLDYMLVGRSPLKERGFY
jgi:hypothetical protein